MDSKDEFFNIINNYYINIADGKVPLELVHEMSELITFYYYDQYNRFAKQYPKSVKRYSAFQLKDLDNTSTFEIIIKYFKNKIPENYKYYSAHLLNMSQEDVVKFEKNREEFYKMW